MLSAQHEVEDLSVDIAFLDFVPIFEQWEANFGPTFVLDQDASKHKLRAIGQKVAGRLCGVACQIYKPSTSVDLGSDRQVSVSACMLGAKQPFGQTSSIGTVSERLRYSQLQEDVAL